MSIRTAPASTENAPASPRRRFSLASFGGSAAQRIRQESFDFLLLAGTAVVLVIIGLVMVFSSSTVTSLVADGNPFTVIVKQGGFACIGLAVMLLISRMREATFMRFAWLALGVSSFLQILVIATPLGVKVAGNTNWLNLGGFQLQPSELIKLSLVIWLGMMVTRKQAYLGSFRRGLLPILIGAGAPILLVVIGGDLGTTVVMVVFVFGALLLTGVRFRLFLVPLAVVSVGVLFVVVSSANRMTRVLTYLGIGGSNSSDYLSTGWQLQHGMYALANGGLFGVGIGNSTAKWSWLPAADNDFIFAIIGEELGLIGALVVLALFGLLFYAFLRVFNHALTPFGRTASAAVMVWVMFQAVANIAVVLGIAPVLGVPLPLVSSGGTALVSTLAAIGIVLSIARSTAAADAPDSAAAERVLS